MLNGKSTDVCFRSEKKPMDSRTVQLKSCCRCQTWKSRLKNPDGLRSPSSYATNISHIKVLYWTICLLVLLVKHGTCSISQTFYVEENTPVNTVIGQINIGGSNIRYSPPSIPNFDLSTANGVITVTGMLDREDRDIYKLYAVSGKRYVEVNIIVTDVNDNSPEFKLRPNVTSLTISEAAAQNYKTALGSVVDRDVGNNSTQGCEIVEGNVDGTFLLETSRQQGGLVLDLVVNNYELDYEVTPFYSLVLKAFDGGSPQRTSTIRINITVQDVNDNSPMFAHSHYSAHVPEDAKIGHVVMRVSATDIDSGRNGQVSYEVDYGYSDSQDTFQVNGTTGVIYVNQPLDYEGGHKLYKVVIKARDRGEHPLEDTTTVTINVTDVNDNPPDIDIHFLDNQDGLDKNVGHVMENEPPGGAYIARISVSDEDVSTPVVNVTLHGGEDYFGLVTRDNTVYLISLAGVVDREQTPVFNMKVTAVDSGDPPLRSEKSFTIIVDDVNDNVPHFQQKVYYADIQEVVPPESSVIQLTATDPDLGDNALLTYSIMNTPQTNSDWFQIDSRSGLITTKMRVDCETQSEPKLVVVATDSGQPALSGTTTVIIRIRDVNDNQPVFDQSFYNVTVLENMANGSCVLIVSGLHHVFHTLVFAVI
ncbi:hypothetical protein LSH36_3g28010 [Paralvinella palmiformis]|uniref:Cadherin domain-containing protein n=1 Tax=Paralvinella palmiformis TaxID=53620 RepID=A0AAD9NHG0_9ANNE|nr:hypothetical protein LSH36_3g28010 [Paralvinella palmiformis]